MPPMMMSVVAVALRATSVARSYVQFMSAPVVTEQLVPLERQTVVPPTSRLETLRLVPVAPMNVSAPVRFSDEPVAFVKFRSVTVEEAAANAPVRFKLEPVALVQIIRLRVVSSETYKFVPVPALKVKGPVRFRAEPVATLKFRVVTVDDAALKAPVTFTLEPVADAKVVGPVMLSADPVALVNVTTFIVAS